MSDLSDRTFVEAEAPAERRPLTDEVIRAADHQPLPGFDIALVQDDEALARAVTDAEGRARIAVGDEG